MKYVLPCLAVCVFPLLAAADDWPHWRGPQRNGISAEKGWLDRWPTDGPPIVWKATVGIGFSSVAVSEGKLYTLGHQDGKDTVWCLDADTGKARWSHSYPAALGDTLFEGGPTATPTVHQGRVYTLSRWGDVLCLDAANGQVKWQRNVSKEENMPVPGWGFGGSPIVLDDLLLLNVGRAGMGLEKATGKLAWKSEEEEAGYSTPLLFKRGHDLLALVSSGNAYTAVNPRTGKALWEIRWLTRYGINAADPIIAGEQVFVSSGYGKGAGLFALGDGNPQEVWRSRHLRNQMNSSILIDGFIYGIDGDTTTANALKCIDLKTGEVRWSFDGVGTGSLLAADGKLIVLTDQGELLVGPASPQGFTPSARASVHTGRCWTVPVLANGRIYCRSAAGEVVCADVRRK